MQAMGMAVWGAEIGGLQGRVLGWGCTAAKQFWHSEQDCTGCKLQVTPDAHSDPTPGRDRMVRNDGG